MRGKYNALEVAKFFIGLSNENRTAFDSDNLTNMKLQKLLYYAQGYCLAEYGEPLFKEKIYNWSYGPVVREVYDTYKCYGKDEIIDADTVNGIDDNYKVFLESVYERFSKYTGLQLSAMTHSEEPWKTTQNNEEIKKEKIKLYFDNVVLKEFEKAAKEIENGTAELTTYSMEELDKLLNG